MEKPEGCLSYRIAKAICKIARVDDFDELQEVIEKELAKEEQYQPQEQPK